MSKPLEIQSCRGKKNVKSTIPGSKKRCCVKKSNCEGIFGKETNKKLEKDGTESGKKFDLACFF